MSEIGMCQNDAFWPPGRTGRIENERRIVLHVWRDWQRRRRRHEVRIVRHQDDALVSKKRFTAQRDSGLEELGRNRVRTFPNRG